MQAWGQAASEMREELLQVLQMVSLFVPKDEFVNNLSLHNSTEKHFNSFFNIKGFNRFFNKIPFNRFCF